MKIPPNHYIVTEVDIVDGGKHKRWFDIPISYSDLDFYKSVRALGAFFHNPNKQRNWKPNRKAANILYHIQTQLEFDISERHWRESFERLKIPYETPKVTVLNSIWEFFNIIEWDNKTKKWTK